MKVNEICPGCGQKKFKGKWHLQAEAETRKRMRLDDREENFPHELTMSPLELHQTWPVEESPTKWFITECLYELSNAKVVYDTVVKARFPAVFLNPTMTTGNILDLQISAKKALSRMSRNSMITKSLPMEMLYALSPRTGISDSLKTLGFNPALSHVLVVWIHSSPSPPEDQMAIFEKIALQNGNRLPLSQLEKLRDLAALREFYDFPLSVSDLPPNSHDWTKLLCSYITSKIATKE